MVKHIVKRKGQEEHYDERKLYGSVFASCLNVHMKKQEAEKCADKVTKEINKWIKNKKEITSNQIFKEVVRMLKKHDKDAAFMYETHRDIS